MNVFEKLKNGDSVDMISEGCRSNGLLMMNSQQPERVISR